MIGSKLYSSTTRVFPAVRWLDSLFSFYGSKPPVFPEFKPVTYSDKQLFDQMLQGRYFYSDFNFNSFYSWGAENEHRFTTLHGNLVLQLNDYVSLEPVFTIVGQNQIKESFHTLLQYLEMNCLRPELKLVPEDAVAALGSNVSFSTIEDPDNFDYIFSIPDLAKLSGKQFKSKRQAAKRCLREFDIKFEDRSEDTAAVTMVTEAAKRWLREKQLRGKIVDVDGEQRAISKILERLIDQETLKLTIARHKDSIVGFSIDELLSGQYVLSHYFKADPSINGLSELLNKQVAKRLEQDGYLYWNWEQDLGFESLRRMKNSHRPVKKLKKYIVTRSTDI